MIEFLIAVAPLLLIHAAAVVSPGPNMLIALRNALVGGPAVGVATVVGIVSGAAVFLSLGAVGAIALLNLNEDLALAVRIFCAGYLIYLGFNYLRSAWRGSDMKLEARADDAPMMKWRSGFMQGAITNLLNPKSIAYFTTFFTVFVPAGTGAADIAVMGTLMMVISFSWYSFLILLITRPAVLERLRAWMRWVEAVTGTVLCVVGAKLLLNRL